MRRPPDPVAPAAAVVAASEHPVPAHAVAECAGALLESGLGRPTAAWVVAGMPFAGALGEICGALGELLSAGAVAGVASGGVVLGGRVCRDGPALGVVATTAASAELRWLEPGAAIPVPWVGGEGVHVVAADPFSVRPGDLDPGPQQAGRLAGGYLAGGTAPGSNRLVVGGTEHREGAVVLALPGAGADVVVSHGVADISGPMEVTGVIDGVLTALDGLPAAEAFEDVVSRAGEEALVGARELGLRCRGGPGLHPVRRVAGGLEVLGAVAEGDVVRAAVRSPASCRDGLEEDLVRSGAARGGVAVAFLDMARPSPGADAALLAEHLGSADVGLLAGGVLPPGPPGTAVRGAACVALLGGGPR